MTFVLPALARGRRPGGCPSCRRMPSPDSAPNGISVTAPVSSSTRRIRPSSSPTQTAPEPAAEPGRDRSYPPGNGGVVRRTGRCRKIVPTLVDSAHTATSPRDQVSSALLTSQYSSIGRIVPGQYLVTVPPDGLPMLDRPVAERDRVDRVEARSANPGRSHGWKRTRRRRCLEPRRNPRRPRHHWRPDGPSPKRSASRCSAGRQVHLVEAPDSTRPRSCPSLPRGLTDNDPEFEPEAIWHLRA